MVTLFYNNQTNYHISIMTFFTVHEYVPFLKGTARRTAHRLQITAKKAQDPIYVFLPDLLRSIKYAARWQNKNVSLMYFRLPLRHTPFCLPLHSLSRTCQGYFHNTTDRRGVIFCPLQPSELKNYWSDLQNSKDVR